MASLIPGYNYDIFISYRQKDNKHDGWVTEFVNNLKGELESTFKEAVSVYFDINPHDGLLETHDVDESLKDKLKCLVFIPIISRTYCDPKAFAWEHEFKAFVDQASKDQFGLKVKLPGGNVASRVLPVRIYDLDISDIKLCESILGGVLRSVDFIYKSAGVNRPLLSKEENPQDNLNHTNYRDQINKVANSIKEIITSIGENENKPEVVSKEVPEPTSIPRKNNKSKLIAGAAIAFALIILSSLFLPKLFRTEEVLEKSIAVLPFRNDSPDPDNEYVCNGIMEEILTQLQKISDLKVKARTSVEKYRDPERDITDIGRELGVSLILEGSVRKAGNDLRITAQLINAKTGDHLWAETYDGKHSVNIFEFESSVAKKVAASLNAVITPQEEERIDAIPTSEMLAHDLQMRGHEMIRKWRYTGDSVSLKLAFNLLNQSLKADPGYIEAIRMKSMLFSEVGDFDSALYYINKIKAIDPESIYIYNQKGLIYFYSNQHDSALKYYFIYDKINPNNPWTNFTIGQLYCFKEELIKGFRYFQKAIDLGGDSEPEINQNIAYVYFCIDYYAKAEKYLKNAISLRSECLLIQFYDYLLVAQGKYNEALHYLDSVCNIIACEQQCHIMRFYIYTTQNEFEIAEQYFNKAISAGYTRNENDDIYLAYIYSKTGRKKEAISILNNSIRRDESELSLKHYFSTFSQTHLRLAAAWALLGDNEKALYYLSKFESERLPLYEMPYKIRTFPVLDNLRNDPEFKAILKRIEHEKDSIRTIVMEMEKRGELNM